MTEHTLKVADETLRDALRHAINYHGIDADLATPDHVIADLLLGEVSKWLRGETDVQVFERMTAEERAKIGIDDNPPASCTEEHEMSQDTPLTPPVGHRGRVAMAEAIRRNNATSPPAVVMRYCTYCDDNTASGGSCPRCGHPIRG